MIRLRWFLLLLAMATVFATWRVWWVAENRSALSLMQAAESRLARDSADHDAALRELELALELARQSGDREVAEQALRMRAQVNMERRNHLLTIEDCDLILQGYSPQDPYVLNMAARSAFGLGELQRAIDYATMLVEVQSDQPISYNLLASLHRELAEDALLDIHARLDEELPSRRAKEGLESARRAAALPPDDPHARSAFEQLDGLVTDRESRTAHRALTLRARAHLQAAREAWLDALSVGRTGASIEGLQELLARGGLQEEVISLGRSILRRPSFPGSGGVVVRTALAETKLGRISEARKIILDAKEKRPDILKPERLDDETLIEWTVLLHELQMWADLETSAKVMMNRRDLMRERKELRTTLYYLIGVSLLEQNRTQAAMPSLTRAGRYATDDELIPGEQVLAWFARATAERRMALRQEEQRSIAEVTRVDAVPEPDGGRAARAFGEALERQARHLERGGNPTRALELLAQATPYLPERRSELEGRWRRLGEQALEAQGRTLQQYRQLFSLQARLQPSMALNSWATVEIAQQQLDRGNAPQAITLVRRRLEDLPYFPPLLAVAGDAYAADEDWRRAISAWLTLGQLFGYTPELAEKFASVPRDRFPPEDLIAWAALDPRRALLSGMVRDLVNQGQPDLALQAVRYLGGASTSSEEYLLAADLSASDRDWVPAFESVSKIPADDPVFPEAASLLVRSALEVGNPRRDRTNLGGALAKVHAAPGVDPNGFPAAIDALLARALPTEAAALCGLLTSRVSSRDPEILLRLAVAEVSLGNVDAATEALDRAEVFQTVGEATVGRLLLAVDTQDAEAVSELALQLIIGPFQDDPLREGIVRILYGDLDRALPLLAAADREQEGLDFPVRLAFLTALVLASETDEEGEQTSTGDVRLDRELDFWRSELTSLSENLGPEHILALLLSIVSDPWQGWASTRLVQLAPVLGGRAWAQLLTAHATASLGRLGEAQKLALPLTRPSINLPWAWVLLEQMALEHSGGVVDYEVVRARVGRVLAIGGRGLDPNETPQLVAEVLVFMGREKSAQRVLETGLARTASDDRRRNGLLIDLARTSFAAGNLQRSRDCFDELLAVSDDETFSSYIPELIDLLAALRANDELTPTEHFARLEGLAARFPDDPAPVRAIAEQLLQSGDALQSSPVSRALTRLERFRDATRRVPLESLRRGEAARWTSVFARLDPDAAVDLAYQEILAAPYSIELWRTWAEALRAARRYEEALATLRILAAVVPDLGSMKSLAQVLMEGDDDPRLALAAAAQARGRLEAQDVDPELDLIEGVALTFSSQTGYRSGIKKLSVLLTKAREGSVDLEPWRVAKPLIEALHLGNNTRDLGLAVEIAERAADDLEEEDGLRAAWFRAMSLVAAQDRG